ncbi:DUF4870 domain-containing protein [Candidatus Omnitrophota bacterium]
MTKKELGTCSLGVSPAMAAGLSYLFGFFSGIAIFILEKNNKFVRFHAMQSTALFIFLFVLKVVVSFIPFINVLFVPILMLIALIAWLYLMVNAFRGEKVSLPIFGEIAEQNI